MSKAVTVKGKPVVMLKYKGLLTAESARMIRTAFGAAVQSGSPFIIDDRFDIYLFDADRGEWKEHSGDMVLEIDSATAA